MRWQRIGAALVVAAGLIGSGYAAETLSTPSPAGATVYFITPKDGDTVKPTFTVRFGLKGMGVAPAGVQFDATGHHHLLVDQPTLPDMTAPLPTTDQILHFGKGQTETELTLAPGRHTLQLVLGNHLHVPHTPPVVSEKITITLKP
jgi:hypothetical protein